MNPTYNRCGGYGCHEYSTSVESGARIEAKGSDMKVAIRTEAEEVVLNRRNGPNRYPILFERAVLGQMRSIVTNETAKAQSDCGADILKRLVSQLGPMETKCIETFLSSHEGDENVDFAIALRRYLFD